MANEVIRLANRVYRELQTELHHLQEALRNNDYKEAIDRYGDMNTIFTGIFRDIQEALIKQKLISLPADTHLEDAELIIEKIKSPAGELADEIMQQPMRVLRLAEQTMTGHFQNLWMALELCDPSHDISQNR